jgi:hypothetical protein
MITEGKNTFTLLYPEDKPFKTITLSKDNILDVAGELIPDYCPRILDSEKNKDLFKKNPLADKNKEVLRHADKLKTRWVEQKFDFDTNVPENKRETILRTLTRIRQQERVRSDHESKFYAGFYCASFFGLVGFGALCFSAALEGETEVSDFLFEQKFGADFYKGSLLVLTVVLGIMALAFTSIKWHMSCLEKAKQLLISNLEEIVQTPPSSGLINN